jgi:type II secretory pathway pseudopilin PulG
MTLIEVTIAVAILMVTLGITAQSVFNFQVTLLMQKERSEAIQRCQSVLTELRERRMDFEFGSTEDGKAFPADFVDAFDSMNTNGWEFPEFTDEVSGDAGHDLGDELRGLSHLQGAKTTVAFLDPEDGGAVDGDTRVIEVHAVTTWQSATGRAMETRLITRMGDR